MREKHCVVVYYDAAMADHRCLRCKERVADRRAYYTFDGKFLAERDQHQEDERIYALRQVATLEERLGLVSLKHG